MSSSRAELVPSVRRPRSLARMTLRLRHQHGPLDGVIDLAHVTGPTVIEQDLHRRRIETRHVLAVALRVQPQEMPASNGMSSRRSRSGGRLTSIVFSRNRRSCRNAPAATCALTSALVAEISRTLTLRVFDEPEPLELARFDDAQQLRLLAHRNIGNLIEKQRAAIRQLEATHPIDLGVGERALHVAEQLGLEDALRPCRRR